MKNVLQYEHFCLFSEKPEVVVEQKQFFTDKLLHFSRKDEKRTTVK